MEKRKLKRALYIVTVFMLLVGSFGCGRKKVEYDTNQNVEGATGTDGEESGSYVGGLAESLHVEEKIQEKFTADCGEEISIYGKVIVPDVNSVSTYRVKAAPFDEAKRQELLDKYSDDGKMYSIDMEQAPKARLYTKILVEENTLNRMGNKPYGYEEDPLDIEAQQEEINQLYRWYESASDEYQEIEPSIHDDENNSFLILRDNIPYYCNVQDNMMFMQPDNWLDVYPDLQGEYVYAMLGVSTGAVSEEETDLEKINGAALGFAQELGASSMAVESTKEFSIDALPAEEGRDYEKIQDGTGYLVSLCKEVDGVPVDNHTYFDMAQHTSIEGMQSSYYKCLIEPERINIYLNDELELIGFEYFNPLSVPEVADNNVQLLDYASIPPILVDELTNNPIYYFSDYNIDEEGNFQYDDSILNRFMKLSFQYFPIKDPNREGEFTLIPTWCLEADSIYSEFYAALYINAMDGSRIDPVAETMELVPWDPDKFR